MHLLNKDFIEPATDAHPIHLPGGTVYHLTKGRYQEIGPGQSVVCTEMSTGVGIIGHKPGKAFAFHLSAEGRESEKAEIAFFHSKFQELGLKWLEIKYAMPNSNSIQARLEGCFDGKMRNLWPYKASDYVNEERAKRSLEEYQLWLLANPKLGLELQAKREAMIAKDVEFGAVIGVDGNVTVHPERKFGTSKGIDR